MRELLLGLARKKVFEPLWSERLLEEWHRAAARTGAGDAAVAQGEIALCRAHFPAALVGLPDTGPIYWLPDPNDVHVLQAALTGGARGIITLNLKDFPRTILADQGLVAVHPDAFLKDALIRWPVLCAPRRNDCPGRTGRCENS